MKAQIIARTYTLTSTFAPIVTLAAGVSLACSGVLVFTGTSGAGYILSDDGSTAVPLTAGIPYPFSNIDLTTLQVKGSGSVEFIGSSY